jgi:hypothetical protein
MRTVANSNTAVARRSIDALLEGYVRWREECAAVRRTYQGWVEADRSQRRLAYAGYVAALDREERAADAYAEQIDCVSRICV